MIFDFSSPEEIYWELFDAVQLSGIFPDSKTFVDAIPKRPVEEILTDFYNSGIEEKVDLLQFVQNNFILPEVTEGLEIPEAESLKERLNLQWEILTRSADEKTPGDSLIPLPYPYVVPGGRFREIYYWDSYFTMLGLKVSNKIFLMESMVNNFAHLINTVGHIPNGNRTYFLSRSQPPYFSLMVELLAQATNNDGVLKKYLPEMLVEYFYWTEGIENLHLPGKRHKRLVKMDDDVALNRFWDDEIGPREESFLEDVELSETTKRFPDKLFRNIRAACESGWDFSSRWLYDPKELKTIQTVAIIPIDLNILLSETERILIKSLSLSGENTNLSKIKKSREARLEGINRYCWNQDQKIYLDYHIKFKETIDRPSLAMLYPLWAGVASQDQAKDVIDFVKANLLKPGGLVTTLCHSGQQWDAPNGWAPLQWIGFVALLNYGEIDLAKSLAERWCALNEKVYTHTGKMMEKYNVEDLTLLAGGGEYPVQDGFGWSNGVYLSMKEWLENHN